MPKRLAIESCMLDRYKDSFINQYPGNNAAGRGGSSVIDRHVSSEGVHSSCLLMHAKRQALGSDVKWHWVVFDIARLVGPKYWTCAGFKVVNM